MWKVPLPPHAFCSDLSFILRCMVPLDNNGWRKRERDESAMIVQTFDVQELIYNIKKIMLKFNNKNRTYTVNKCHIISLTWFKGEFDYKGSFVLALEVFIGGLCLYFFLLLLLFYAMWFSRRLSNVDYTQWLQNINISLTSSEKAEAALFTCLTDVSIKYPALLRNRPNGPRRLVQTNHWANGKTYSPLMALPLKGATAQSSRGMNHSWEK